MFMLVIGFAVTDRIYLTVYITSSLYVAVYEHLTTKNVSKFVLPRLRLSYYLNEKSDCCNRRL